MPRPALTPRLASLVPEQVAVEACARVVDDIRQAAEALRPATLTISVDDHAELAKVSALGRAVAELVRYAQGGSGDPDVVDRVQALLGTTVEGEWLETPLGVALAAGAGRRKLDRGEPLTVRELACLGGIADNALRLLARQGKARTTGSKAVMIPAAEARRWLESRGWKEK